MDAPDLDCAQDCFPTACVRHDRRAGRPPSMGSIVSDALPIRVHWAREADRARAEAVLAAAELAWRVQVDELGFRPPELPDGEDGPELDLYLDDLGDFEAFAYSPLEIDEDVGDGLRGVPAYVVIDWDLPLGWVDSYVAHEFNHVLQYATDLGEPTLPIWEGVATAAQKWTLGAEGTWEDETVPYFQEAPWAPTLVGDGYFLWDYAEVGWAYEYGTALWVLHLDEVLGDGDGTAGARLWAAAADEGPANEPDVVDALLEVSGQDLGGFLNGLARTRWLTGDRWDDRGLADAASWGPDEAVPLEAELTGSGLPAVVVPFEGPHVTGQFFVEITDFEGPLELRAISDGGLGTDMIVLWWSAAGAVGEAEGTTVTVADGAVRVVAAVSNLGDAGWDADDDPYVPGDQVLSISRGASEAPRACGCAATAPPPGLALLAGLSLLWPRRRASGSAPGSPAPASRGEARPR